MKYKKRLAIKIVATSLFLSFLSSGTVFAVDWPTIAGKTINGSTGIADIVSYGFAAAVAFGAIIMFVVIMEAGLRMITGENSGQAKTRLRNGIIGFGLLLLTYAIINTINSNILGTQSLETPCINGVSAEYTKKVDGKDRKFKICANTSQPSIPNGIEDKGENFTPCSLKAAIGFKKENYKGEPSILFDDQSSEYCKDPQKVRLGGYKSMKFIGKQDGAYLYDKTEYELEDDSLGPLYFDAGSGDLGLSSFDNKTKSINIISNYYQKNPSGQESDGVYRGAVLFENPGYRGKSVVVDSNNELLKQSNAEGNKTDLTGKISSLISFKKTLQNDPSKNSGYVYLYAVNDCGKNLSKDEDILSIDTEIDPTKPKPPIDGECGDANRGNFLSVPTSGLCKAGKNSGVALVDNEKYNWSCIGKNKGKTVECSASKEKKSPSTSIINNNYFASLWTGLVKAINEPLEVANKTINIAEDIKKTARIDKKAMLADLTGSPTDPDDPEDPAEIYKNFDEVENGYMSKVGGMYDICKIKIPQLKKGMILSSLEKKISEECEGLFWKKGGGIYDIISFKMDARAGVLIKGDNENSLYWDMTTVEKSGNCIGDIRGSDVFNTDVLGKTVKPKTITIFPTD